MNKYQVSRGTDVREIEANNSPEAIRRFDATQTGPAVNQGLGVTAKLVDTDIHAGEPEKSRYRVTWGPDVREVYAVHEDDAWSQFVGGDENSIAYKYPQTHQRIVEKLDADGNAVDESADADDPADDGGTSPVADLPANEAKDKVHRMTSHDKLAAVIAHDNRVSVVDAARDRQTELGGS